MFAFQEITEVIDDSVSRKVGCVMRDLTCSPSFAKLSQLLEDSFPAEVVLP